MMDWAWAKEHWGRISIIGAGLVALASFVGAYLAVDVSDFVPVSNRRLSDSLQKVERKADRNAVETIQTRIEILLAREETIEERIEELDRRKRQEPNAFWLDRRIVEARKRLEAVQREKERLHDHKSKLETQVH
jgi:chromosome segregation ATPase